MWSCFRGWFGDILPFQRIKSPMSIWIVREFNYSWFFSDNRRLKVFRIPKINLFQNHPHKESQKRQQRKPFRALKREDPSLGESSNKQPTNQRWTDFFHLLFFKQKNHQPQGSLPPNPSPKTKPSVCLLIGWSLKVAYRVVFSQDTMGVVDRRDLLEISGSVGGTQFWMVLWIRDLSSDHPKVRPLPISFPYHSHTSRGSYGSGMGVVWEWGYHYWVSENGAPVNSLVQNGKTERFVGLLSGTLKASRSRTNPWTTGRSWTNIWLNLRHLRSPSLCQDINFGVICGSYIQSSFLTPPLKTHIIPENWWLLQMSDFLSNKNQVVSNIFDFHPYLGKIPILTDIFQRRWNHQLENIPKFQGQKKTSLPREDAPPLVAFEILPVEATSATLPENTALLQRGHQGMFCPADRGNNEGKATHLWGEQKIWSNSFFFSKKKKASNKWTWPSRTILNHLFLFV